MKRWFFFPSSSFPFDGKILFHRNTKGTRRRDDSQKGRNGSPFVWGATPVPLSLHSLYFYFIPKKFPLLIILFPTTFIYFFF